MAKSSDPKTTPDAATPDDARDELRLVRNGAATLVSELRANPVEETSGLADRLEASVLRPLDATLDARAGGTPLTAPKRGGRTVRRQPGTTQDRVLDLARAATRLRAHTDDPGVS